MRETRLDILRWSLILLLAAGLGVGPAGGQTTDSLLIRIDAWGSIDRVALYDGDATVGGYSTWGGTLSLGLRSPFPIGAELFLSFSPRNDDPYKRSPRILVPGGWATFSLLKDPTSGVDLFLGVGASYVDIEGWPDFSACHADPECFAEGGPAFTNGGAFTFVWGGGVTYSFPRLLSLRFDVRAPGSSSVSEQTIPRFGFGTGLRVW